MEAETIVLLVYAMITLLPVHIAIFLGIRRENKKRRHLLMAIWRFQNKLRVRR